MTCAVLYAAAPEPVVAQRLTAELTGRALAEPALAHLSETSPDATSHPVTVSLDGPAHLTEPALAALLANPKLTASGSGTPLTLTSALDGPSVTSTLSAGAPKPIGSSSRRVGTWVSMLPPALAVLLAVFTRRLILSLAAALLVGAAAQAGWMPHSALYKAGASYVVGPVADTFNLYIIAFTISLVGMVHVMLRSGGLAGLLEVVRARATGARSTRVATALMGAAVFFDDYANTIVVGATMRPLTDARRICREKLAYLVDSTSAPIAGVAVVSTWIGYEVGLFDVLSQQLALGKSGYEIFFEILPLRFYCLLTLFFVLANAYSGRDFGPMLAAERRARATGALLREGAEPLGAGQLGDLHPPEGAPLRARNATLPVALVLCGVIFGMYWSGWSGEGGASLPSLLGALSGKPVPLGEALSGLGSFTVWRDAFSNADGAKVLCSSAVLGSLLAIALAASQRIITVADAARSWARAIPGMRTAVSILVLAWAMRSLCDDLSTSVYLIGAVQDLLAPLWLPVVTFALAALVAFATGTSWGTMGILLPAMIPLAHHMSTTQPGAEIIVALCLGAVLDGAIFGDHCSPISDTTVMSSIASACDHLDHVRTQIPYAVTTMLAAASFGYVGVAQGLHPAAALALGALALLGVLFTLGKHVPDADAEAAST
jgi:Na+/H+ antiporter NhaC